MEVDASGAGLDGSIDLAVNAIEVAGGVGVQVDSDAEASGSAGEDGVDIAKSTPVARMTVKIAGCRRLSGFDGCISALGFGCTEIVVRPAENLPEPGG